MAMRAWVIWLGILWKRGSDSRGLGRPEPACLERLWGWRWVIGGRGSRPYLRVAKLSEP